jgi:saccharopine dehydrogenase-like NADP-dependent oxidoreductase
MENQKKILVLGAGKSAIYLLDYLRDHAVTENWEIHIADLSTSHLKQAFETCMLSDISVSDESERLEILIAACDLVISMVPASMHPIVATSCLRNGKNLITPSYVSDELKAMSKEVEAKGLLFLNEMGVDPGIDHMSAMQIIHRIQSQGGKISAFESYCGGLIAPESDDNPWHYKFTWNPRNVILAGQGTAKFLQYGTYKYIPYHQLFERTTLFTIDHYGTFEGYANRDSLKYIEAYGLEGIETMYRGTFRKAPFCKAWQVFVSLGMTDDSYIIESSEKLSNRAFLNLFLESNALSIEQNFSKLTGYAADSEIYQMMDWLELFSDKAFMHQKEASPAKILQVILEQKLKLAADDKDMLVMLHKFSYQLNQSTHHITSSLVVLGENQVHTAMAKTVGLPIAIAARLILNGTINTKGVHIPVIESIYQPIMQELSKLGIQFVEQEEASS